MLRKISKASSPFNVSLMVERHRYIWVIGSLVCGNSFQLIHHLYESHKNQEIPLSISVDYSSAATLWYKEAESFNRQSNQTLVIPNTETRAMAGGQFICSFRNYFVFNSCSYSLIDSVYIYLVNCQIYIKSESIQIRIAYIWY